MSIEAERLLKLAINGPDKIRAELTPGRSGTRNTKVIEWPIYTDPKNLAFAYTDLSSDAPVSYPTESHFIARECYRDLVRRIILARDNFLLSYTFLSTFTTYAPYQHYASPNDMSVEAFLESMNGGLQSTIGNIFAKRIPRDDREELELREDHELWPFDLQGDRLCLGFALQRDNVMDVEREQTLRAIYKHKTGDEVVMDSTTEHMHDICSGENEPVKLATLQLWAHHYVVYVPAEEVFKRFRAGNITPLDGDGLYPLSFDINDVRRHMPQLKRLYSVRQKKEEPSKVVKPAFGKIESGAAEPVIETASEILGHQRLNLAYWKSWLDMDAWKEYISGLRKSA